MRLAYLTPQYPKVSHTFVRREIHALEAAGHDVLRISIRRPDGELTVDPADRAEREKTVFCLAAGPARLAAAVAATALRRPGPALRTLGRALRLGLAGGRGPIAHLAYWVEACFVLGRLEAHGSEHVHVHFGTNAATVAWLVRDLGGPPFSMTVHGPDEIDAPLAHRLGDKIRASRFTVAISHYTSAQLRRWVPPSEWSKLHVVRCSVDEGFLDAATPVPETSRTLLCVGRLCPQKGQLVLLEAFAAVADRHPDARLVLAGDGEMRADVEAAIARLGLGARVEITGWIDEAAVRGHLAACRALVLPSFAEGLPVVIMEALAAGRPVLSTWVAGIPELVRPGENGWLVPAADREGLAVALEAVLTTPAERLTEMGERGARAVRERHHAATEAGRLAALFAGPSAT
jgi:glycosyltransferase involved in cell wall biosynthesis